MLCDYDADQGSLAAAGWRERRWRYGEVGRTYMMHASVSMLVLYDICCLSRERVAVVTLRHMLEGFGMLIVD